MAWVYLPVTQELAEFNQNVAKYPNIKTGEEFKGYKSQ